MSAIEQSKAYGSPTINGKQGCADWRAAHFFDRLPGLAEELAQGFLHVAKRHGNAAGNRWLKRNAADLIDPEQIYQRFAPIADDLRRGVIGIRRQHAATIDGLKAASAWLTTVQQRLVIGSFNASHDDDALVDYAKAKARAVEDYRHNLIGSIAEHNRLQRYNLLPAAKPTATSGKTVSQQVRRLQLARARQRNPLSPPPRVASLAGLTFTRCHTLSLAVVDLAALQWARAIAAQHGIEPPPRKGRAAAQLARLGCSLWWRRKLRRLAGRRLEQVQREAHRVHRRAGIYCSDMTVERRQGQQARNRALLETIEAINQEGQVYTLAELAELGLANPDHRRAELMLRIRDTENEARRLGHLGMFYTLTTPSRFHPVLSKSAKRNPKYDGATPREAQQHLQGLWARARAKLHRQGLDVYGIRVVEPHHDGTPHWHLLLWMAAEDQDSVTEILREHAEEESPEELIDRFGNKTTARFKAVAIDYRRGTAAGYVAKYISKNINGEQFMDADKYDHAMTDSAPRIEAWASVWGIRQFQFLGLPSVTVWREVRRLTEKQEEQLRHWEEATRPEPTVSERLHAIRNACNAGQWDLFLRLMGGPNTKRKDQPVHPWRITAMDPKADKVSHATGEMTENIEARGRYGDPVQVTKGLVVKGRGDVTAQYLTRLYRWDVRSRRPQQEEGTHGAGEAGDAWTCVTNCTEGPRPDGQSITHRVDTTPRKPSDEELAAQMERFNEWRSSEEVRAEVEDAELEAQLARQAAHRLIQHDPTARQVRAERGIYIEPPPYEPEEYFPPELC